MQTSYFTIANPLLLLEWKSAIKEIFNIMQTIENHSELKNFENIKKNSTMESNVFHFLECVTSKEIWVQLALEY